ncbi:MAG: hypothetical protein NTW03_05170 [Verrucomicrobia bacterium]|nr:hypothetical protein [Verrucomicrobiota bacterium]
MIENWMALGLATVLMAAMTSFSLYMGKSFQGLFNYVDLEGRSQKALDQMTTDIRQAQCLTDYATNQLVFLDANSNVLSYTYSPTDRTLVRSNLGVATVLLSQCDFLCFSNFQRNPIPGAYEQFPVTTDPTQTKLVSVTWLCSRTVIGTRLNTESVQTAKIVIRKE